MDTIDGLVPLVPVVLSRINDPNKAALKKDLKDCIWVNRASRPLEGFGEIYADMLQEAIGKCWLAGVSPDLPDYDRVQP